MTLQRATVIFLGIHGMGQDMNMGLVKKMRRVMKVASKCKSRNKQMLGSYFIILVISIMIIFTYEKNRR